MYSGDLTKRGCREFVMARAIMLMGVLNIRFRPLQVPVLDDYPGLDQDG